MKQSKRIQFKSDKALLFLLSNGIVYTFRKCKRSEGIAIVLNKFRVKVGTCNITLVGRCFYNENNYRVVVLQDRIEKTLEDFVRFSGFKSVKEWIGEIVKLNHGLIPQDGYLYRVELLEVKK